MGVYEGIKKSYKRRRREIDKKKVGSQKYEQHEKRKKTETHKPMTHWGKQQGNVGYANTRLKNTLGMWEKPVNRKKKTEKKALRRGAKTRTTRR